MSLHTDLAWRSGKCAAPRLALLLIVKSRHREGVAARVQYERSRPTVGTYGGKRHDASVVDTLALSWLGGAVSAQTGPSAFSFVAFGDMPYRDSAIAKVDRLVGAIDRLKPAFTIHVGNIKSGAAPCGDTDLRRSIAQINTLAFGKPVLVVHGDNHVLEFKSFKDTSLRPVPNTFRP